MLIKVSVFLLALLFIYGCCSTKAVTSVQKTNQEYKKVAEEKFGISNNIEYNFNHDSIYVLIKKINKPTTQLPQQTVSYFVYDNVKDRIVHEDRIVNGSVKWLNDSQLLISITPGIVQGDESENNNIFIYDLKTKRKIDYYKKSINH